MRARTRSTAAIATLLLAGLGIAGCSNPDAAGPPAARASVQSPGEEKAPPPATQSPAGIQGTPQAALARYARLYIDWSWNTLATDQRRLAAIAVGSAAVADRQAAAQAAADSTLARAKVSNQGQLVSIARDRTRPGMWVVVTRERTTGGGEYEGLPAAYHVTLAKLEHLPGGWAVSEWLPKS